MKICTNCGQEITKDSRYCPECGSDLSINSTFVEETEIEKKKGNMLCIGSLLCLLLPVIIDVLYIIIFCLSHTDPFTTSFRLAYGNLWPYIFPFVLIGLILMIIARINHTQNKFTKILMWIYLIAIGLSFLIFMIILAACMADLYN